MYGCVVINQMNQKFRATGYTSIYWIQLETVIKKMHLKFRFGLFGAVLLTTSGLIIAYPTTHFFLPIGLDNGDYEPNSAPNDPLDSAHTVSSGHVKGYSHRAIMNLSGYGLVSAARPAARVKLTKRHAATTQAYLQLADGVTPFDNIVSALNAGALRLHLNASQVLINRERGVTWRKAHCVSNFTTPEDGGLASQLIRQKSMLAHNCDWPSISGYFLLQYPPLDTEQRRNRQNI